MAQSFGAFLSEKRKEKKLTQKELAKQLFVSESAVSKWEQDVAHPDITLLPRLAEILGTTEHELITASIDESSRKTAVQARKWRKLAFSWNLFFALSYGIALLTCFIVNLSVSHTLSWFWIVFFSLLLSASFTTIPQYIRAHRAVWIPTIELLSLVALLGTCCVYSGGNWFFFAVLPVLFGFSVLFTPVFLSRVFSGKPSKKHVSLLSVLIDFVLLEVMLLYIALATKGKWFVPVALPLTLLGFALTALFASFLSYVRLDGWLKTGVSFFFFDGALLLFGKTVPTVLSRYDINYDNFAPFRADFSVWHGDTVSYNVQLITLLSLAFLGCVCFLIAFLRKRHLRA